MRRRYAVSMMAVLALVVLSGERRRAREAEQVSGEVGGISDLIYSGERRVYIAGDREEDASASIATRLLTRLT